MRVSKLSSVACGLSGYSWHYMNQIIIRFVGESTVAERESADQAHNETERGVEKGEERTGDRP